MKIAGSIMLAVGLAVMATLLILPVQVSVLGSNVSCQNPIVAVRSDLRSDDEFDLEMHRECRQRSTVRLVLAAVVGGGLALAGAIMLSSASEMSEAERRRSVAPAPGWFGEPSQPGLLRWWNGQQWTGETRQQ